MTVCPSTGCLSLDALRGLLGWAAFFAIWFGLFGLISLMFGNRSRPSR